MAEVIGNGLVRRALVAWMNLRGRPLSSYNSLL
jgi:hypothetical protein